ncbi:hypothetical protein G6L39_025945 (plasmid) [Agrobacterium fabrum]|nr:hypothetical protein [Agrobacterium fabrum]WCK80211.1 hypothetical protein G6L39_025945 [Agrobacterium fabrum]
MNQIVGRHSTSVLLRSDMGASRSKAAGAPRCGRIIASLQGRPASVAARKCGQHHPQTILAPPGDALTLGRAAGAHVLLPAPEGLSRTTTGTPGFAETSLIKDPIMAPLNRSTQKNRPAKSPRATTLEMVRHACPDTVQALRISESFGLALIDSDGIRALHRGQLIESADALKDGLAEKAMQIHMQRIVGSFVGSAYGAGQFYSRAVTEARDLTTKLSNDTRDEDLDGPVGFDSRAQRKREFAADMGLQAHVLRMAAEGAVSAYEDITGETWKPYERTVEQPANSVDQKAATAQMAAFE